MTRACIEVAIVLMAIFSCYKHHKGMLLLLITVGLVTIFGVGYDVYMFCTAGVKPDARSLIAVVPIAITVLLIPAVVAARKYDRLKREMHKKAAQF